MPGRSIDRLKQEAAQTEAADDEPAPHLSQAYRRRSQGSPRMRPAAALFGGSDRCAGSPRASSEGLPHSQLIPHLELQRGEAAGSNTPGTPDGARSAPSSDPTNSCPPSPLSPGHSAVRPRRSPNPTPPRSPLTPAGYSAVRRRSPNGSFIERLPENAQLTEASSAVMQTESADEHSSLRHSMQPGVSLVSRARLPSPLRREHAPRGSALARGEAPQRVPSILARGAEAAAQESAQPMDEASPAARSPRPPPSPRENSPPAKRPAGTPDSRAAAECTPNDPTDADMQCQ